MTRTFTSAAKAQLGESWDLWHKHFTHFFQFERIWKDRIITGDPETCVAEFKRWSKATGSTYFLLRLRHAHSGGPPHKDIIATIKRFGKDVIPYLAD